MTSPVDWFTPFHTPVDPRETSPFRPCSRCRGPNGRPDQRYCRDCATAANREFRARQRAARAQLAGVIASLAELAAGRRRAGCPVCAESAQELERLVKIIAPLARATR